MGFIRRLQADPELMSRLRHPNILTVDDFWREADGAYLVTRVFTGSTLEAALAAGALPAGASATVDADVRSALAAARGRGFVHADVGPGSILVEDGHGLLHGFGFVPAGPRPARHRGGRRVGQPVQGSPRVR